MNILISVMRLGARREPTGWVKKITTPYAALVSLWVLYAAVWAIIDPWELSAVFLASMLALIFITIGAFPEAHASKIPWFDWIFSGLSLSAAIYFHFRADMIAQRISLFDPLTGWDIFFGTVLFILTLEATRRSVGIGLTVIVCLFVLYIFFGHLLPGSMSHGFVSYNDFLDQLVYTTNGILGLPVRVAATYAFLFVLFGSILHGTGGGIFYDNMAAIAAGRYTGGPAKVAVLSSAFFGTLSGSPTSDVVTTGSFTIPMMKRLGYSAVFAGAVETAASTGGSILPPVMGSAAFMMAELTSIPYIQIAVAAFIPAILYYYCVFIQVHFRSERLGLTGLPADQIPKLRNTLRTGGLFFVPLAVMVATLLMGYTPTYVAVVASFTIVVVSMVRRETRVGFKEIYHSLATTTMRMVPVTAACAAAGLVVGGITMTGLAGKFGRLIFMITGEHFFFSLVMIAGLCILLGMGMPTPSAYIMAAVLAGPLMETLGVPTMAAHLFMVYFAVLSAITPPVAVAAYAASSIAMANPIKIAIAAVRLSIILFLIPFIFVYNQSLLLQGSVLEIIIATVSAIIGITSLSIALEGWFTVKLIWWKRLICTVGGLLMMVPGKFSDLIGIGLILIGVGNIIYSGLMKKYAFSQEHGIEQAQNGGPERQNTGMKN